MVTKMGAMGSRLLEDVGKRATAGELESLNECGFGSFLNLGKESQVGPL